MTQNLDQLHQATAVLYSEDPEFSLPPEQLEQFELPEDPTFPQSEGHWHYHLIMMLEFQVSYRREQDSSPLML